ncbi:hypothetical protein RRG08_056517 [Elysia crispata]|uniref:Uncharacterized protein n=1 Tax=Elysia crispata TaxID=231223 RepID=A0AAE1E577_9GAST|nr:hypothetical protein RRG08_056517 [Elysia crispata]
MKICLLLILTMAVATSVAQQCDLSYNYWESSKPCWGRHKLRLPHSVKTYCCSNRRVPRLSYQHWSPVCRCD